MPANYSHLVAAWNSTALPSGVTGTPLGSAMTTAQKLAAINAWTMAGPTADVQPSQVVAYLALNGRLAALLKYAATPPGTAAGLAAANLAAVLAMGTNAPVFNTSQANVYAAIEAMLNALISDASSGLIADDASNLLALAQTRIPWWQASVAAGGAGLTSLITSDDLVAAGDLT